MYQSRRELWVAFFAIVIISIVYLSAVILLGGIPAASDFFGHSLGVVGFLLMLMTEILYSLRKRSRSARWGRVSSWLQFHIVTGLVGPYMVLLHSSWKFNGLAGIVMLMTVVVVISGLIGRYIYTAIPRTVDGMEMEANELKEQIDALEEEIGVWMAKRPEVSGQVKSFTTASVPAMTKLFGEVRYRFNQWSLGRKMNPGTRAQMVYLGELERRRRSLVRQRRSTAQARRLMALWHTIHVPIGLALFTAAFIHIGAAIYYASLL